MQRSSMMIAFGVLLLVASLDGCGHSGKGASAANAGTASNAGSTSALATAAHTPAVDLQTAPLGKADIELYLEVMRAAADRVQHPTAADLEAIRQQQAFESNADAVASANAPAEATAEAQQQRLQAEVEAAMKAGELDKARALVMQQAKLAQNTAHAPAAVQMPDADSFQRATDLTHGHADRVIVRERKLDEDHWDNLVDLIEEIFPPPNAVIGDCDADCAPQLTPEQQLRERQHEAVLPRDRALLAPYAEQIRKLVAIVRKGKS